MDKQHLSFLLLVPLLACLGHLVLACHGQIDRGQQADAGPSGIDGPPPDRHDAETSVTDGPPPDSRDAGSGATDGPPSISDAAGAVDADGAPHPFVVHLSPNGKDTNAGSKTDPVRTLGRAQQIIKSQAPAAPVEIRIAQGTYSGQQVLWTYYHPDFSTTFLPAGYNGSAGFPKPIFDGLHSGKFLLDFKIRGGRTHLNVLGLEIRNYWAGGIRYWGNRHDRVGGYLAGNRVEHCRFLRIGNKWDPAQPAGIGAIDTLNLRDSYLVNNEFLDLENRPGDEEYLHAVYLAHYSSGNVVAGNLFHNVCGDVVRVRDTSNRNLVFDNTLVKAGRHGYLSEWFCHTGYDTSCAATECPSWGNLFFGNTTGPGYQGATPAETWFVGYTGSDGTGGATANELFPAGCVDRRGDGWQRFATYPTSYVDSALFYRASDGLFRLQMAYASGELGQLIRQVNTGHNWSIIANPDVDGDGDDELLFYRASDGQYSLYELNSHGNLGPLIHGTQTGTGWTTIATPDVDGDGDDEILFYRASTGAWSLYELNATGKLGPVLHSTQTGKGWTTIATPDVDGDGDDELAFYRAASGELKIYELTASGKLGALLLSLKTADAWSLVVALDATDSGSDELAFYNTATGAYSIRRFTATHGLVEIFAGFTTPGFTAAAAPALN